MSALRRIGLYLEAIVFTVLVSGAVLFWLPDAIFDARTLALPASWSVAQFLPLLPLGLGTAIYLRCLWEFATRGRGVPAMIDHPKQLVVSGLYRYVRNPMYLGVLLFLFGESLFVESWSFLFYAVAWLLFVHLIVLLYEEPNLRRRFGPAYERYTARVHRWLPGRKYAGWAYSRLHHGRQYHSVARSDQSRMRQGADAAHGNWSRHGRAHRGYTGHGIRPAGRVVGALVTKRSNERRSRRALAVARCPRILWGRRRLSGMENPLDCRTRCRAAFLPKCQRKPLFVDPFALEH